MTRLRKDQSVTRELSHHGMMISVTLTPTEIRFRVKGKRKVWRLSIDDALRLASNNRERDEGTAQRLLKRMRKSIRALGEMKSPSRVKQLLDSVARRHLLVCGLVAAKRVHRRRERTANKLLEAAKSLTITQLMGDEVEPNDCPECARSFGPHYTGPCEHDERGANESV